MRRLLAERHSCRGFKPDPVSIATIQSIVALAQRSASWCNSQPWQVIITSGVGTQRYSHALQAAAAADRNLSPAPTADFPFLERYEGAYLARRRECGLQLYESVAIARGDEAAARQQLMENYRFFGAPHAAVVTTPAALGTYGAVDCGAFVSTFMLAAQAHGVATIAQAAIASFSDAVRAHFAISKDRLILCGISFGYEDQDHPANVFRTGRAEWGEVVKMVEK